MVVIGPWDDEIQRRWDVFRQHIDHLPFFEPLTQINLIGDVQILAYTPTAGWQGFAADERSDWSYSICVQRALHWLSDHQIHGESSVNMSTKELDDDVRNVGKKIGSNYRTETNGMNFIFTASLASGGVLFMACCFGVLWAAHWFGVLKWGNHSVILAFCVLALVQLVIGLLPLLQSFLLGDLDEHSWRTCGLTAIAVLAVAWGVSALLHLGMAFSPWWTIFIVGAVQGFLIAKVAVPVMNHASIVALGRGGAPVLSWYRDELSHRRNARKDPWMTS